MNKRDFLKKMGILGIAVVSSDLLLQACSTAENTSNTAANSKYKCWVWSNLDKEASDKELKDRFRTMHKMGITGILFGGDDERIYKLAKEQGLETHIWSWTLNRGDEFIKQNHPEWYSINRIGESCFDKPPYVDYYRWLCPSREEVHQYLAEKTAEQLEKPYIDGIHLDYIRYCDVILPKALWKKYDLVQNEELPQFDYCYCEVCCSKFKEQEGVDPKDLMNPPGNEAWLQYRYDTVTNVVNQLAAQVHNANKVISAAVFPTPSIAKKLVRQDWVNWDLDMIFPMVYQGFYEKEIPWIGEAVTEGVTALDGKFPMYAGLYMPDLPGEDDLKKAIQTALKAGATGVSVFGKMEDQHWKQFSAAVKN
jgi:hypothetical protein